jgi:hypothetical protein
MGSATTRMPRWAYPYGNGMATQKDLNELADDNPEMLDAYYQAMKAVIEYRNQVTAIQPGQLTTAQLKKTQLAATQQLMQFATSVVFKVKSVLRQTTAGKRRRRRWQQTPLKEIRRSS